MLPSMIKIENYKFQQNYYSFFSKYIKHFKLLYQLRVFFSRVNYPNIKYYYITLCKESIYSIYNLKHGPSTLQPNSSSKNRQRVIHKQYRSFLYKFGPNLVLLNKAHSNVDFWKSPISCTPVHLLCPFSLWMTPNLWLALWLAEARVALVNPVSDDIHSFVKWQGDRS